MNKKLPGRLMSASLFKNRKQRKEQRFLTPVITRVMAEFDIAELVSPVDISKLAHKLYRRHPSSVDVKRHHPSVDLGQLIKHLSSGHSRLSAVDGVSVLKSANYCFDPTNHGQTQADIGQHFLASSSLADKGRVLYECAAFQQPARMLEIGTAYGMSATFLMRGAARGSDRVAQMDTVEFSPERHAIACANLARQFEHGLDCHLGTAQAHIQTFRCASPRPSFDLVFYDGPHDGESYIRDFESLLPMLAPGAMYIVDDIRWYDRDVTTDDPKCYAGWQKIADHPSVGAALEIDGSVGIALISAQESQSVSLAE